MAAVIHINGQPRCRFCGEPVDHVVPSKPFEQQAHPLCGAYALGLLRRPEYRIGVTATSGTATDTTKP